VNIAVIGCGYVGKAIASLWRERGAFVTATTRTENNLPTIKPYCDQAVVLSSDSLDSLAQILEENSVVYICVAPKDAAGYEETYLHTAQTIREALPSISNRGLIVYFSSTSVYAEDRGRWVDEDSPLDEKRPHARILIQTENTLLECRDFGWDVCIFRLGEIYGPGRDLRQKALHFLKHPGECYGENYTNMVHVGDIAHAAQFAADHSLKGIFNLVDNTHPIRKELYAQVCALYNLPLITWGTTSSTLHGQNKRASNDLIKRRGLPLLYPDRFL
jgi:nucleoside-diphosphate-sugar epimerase